MNRNPPPLALRFIGGIIPSRLTWKIIGWVVGLVILVHLLALVCAAFNVLWFPQVVGLVDGTVFLIFILMCLAFLCILPFLIFWGFIVLITGLGVGIGTAGLRKGGDR